MNVYKEIIRPQIPYRGSIPGGLHEGKLIEIQGSVPYGSDCFEINLLTGLDPASDRALHISVRFSIRVAVRNAMMRGEWGPEERHGPFPFQMGREFKMLILVNYNGYRIAVDNQHCWEFAHRTPFSRVTTLFINGAVQLERIQFVNKSTPGVNPVPVMPGHYIPGQIDPGFNPAGIGTCFPTTTTTPTCPPAPYMPPAAVCPPGPVSSWPTGPCTPASTNLAPVYNPIIPYAYPIYGGLRTGMMIYISGRPTVSPDKFTFNLQEGTNPYPPPDIAFHFDARFYNRTVVRNTRVNDYWQEEELAVPYFPFSPGVNFDMIIRVDGDKFMVALNGQHFLEFRHRLTPMTRFDTLFIENDIVVSSIRFA